MKSRRESSQKRTPSRVSAWGCSQVTTSTLRPRGWGAMKGRPAWPNAQHLVFRRANSMRDVALQSPRIITDLDQSAGHAGVRRFCYGVTAHSLRAVRPRPRTGRHWLRRRARSRISMPPHPRQLDECRNEKEDRRSADALAGMVWT
jgi:hypothetical protein